VATGKSAVGRRLAQHLGLRFVDSGLMYRAIALAAVDRGVDLGAGAELTHLAAAVPVRIEDRRVWAAGEELTERIYSQDVSEVASRIAKVAGVRLAMVAQQRAMGRGGVVMAGRDIGTVVFPDADFKFFLTASLGERVRRRAAQLEERGERVDAEGMATEVEARDLMDSQRSVAPLRPAEDAEIVDTDALDVEAVVRLLRSRIEADAGR
jgi:cytidylate kinase